MARRSSPRRIAVVDGSNLATEGRSEPSLDQLREAVEAFRSEYDFDEVVVIVDASFEHRVPDRQRPAVRRAIDEGWMITPPAGVVGRGDTFILMVAKQADAVVVSNDSFQEFHGEHPWLFDEGRLIGGKPVPGVGWVFVPRLPVRGVVSRRAVKEAADTAKRTSPKKAASTKRADTPKKTAPKKAAGTAKKAAPSKAADTPKKKAASTKRADTPKKTAPKKAAGTAKKAAPGRAPAEKRTGTPKRTDAPSSRRTDRTSSGRAGAGERAGTATPTEEPATTGGSRRRGRGRRRGGGEAGARESAPATPTLPDGSNPARAWRSFRRSHPEGSTVEARVDRFSSHGAYASTEDGLVVYLPLALLADPPPRRARDVVSIGERRGFVVHRFDEARHGIDVGIVPFSRASGKTGGAMTASTRVGADARSDTMSRATRTRRHDVATKKAAKKTTAKKKAPAKKATKKTAAKRTTKKAPAKKATAKKATKKAPAKKTTAKKAAKKAPAKKTAAKRTTKKAPAKKTTAKKAAKKAPAKKTAAKRTTKKAPAKRTTNKTTAKKATKKAPAKKTTAKKATKKTAAKRTAKKAPAKKTAAKRTAKKAPAKKATKKAPAKRTTKKTTAKRTAKKTAAKRTIKKATTRTAASRRPRKRS